ncbi:MAG: glycosyltransferase [Actinobacteria bacterium]|nr:glycosyltransferase [Actinomycetota bacterium]
MLRYRVRSFGPLRVLFIVPDLTVGGAERHLVTLLPAMDPTRFAPSMICIGMQGELFAELVAADIPARALGRTKREFGPTLAQLISDMRRNRPDVVVVRGYNAEVLGRAAALLCGVPRVVVWLHHSSDITPRGRVQRLADWLLGSVTSAYYGVAFGQLPYFTEVLGYPPDKVRIIHNGIDPAQFPYTPDSQRGSTLALSLGIAAEHAVVGIVAVLRPEKDHATFLQAARLVLERIPRARFLVVGDGPLRSELTRLAGELGITGSVIFTGSRSDVRDLLPLVDVFALTSTTECFPMALLEAMAIGRPAVCTAVGGVPEIIDEAVTGHMVPPRDPAALADRLVDLLSDPARARVMGRAARMRLESEFTLQRSVCNAERTIEETAGRWPVGVWTASA